MSWLGIEGHDQIAEKFRTCLRAGRLGSAFLFVGQEGIGKRSFALKLAQSLLCSQTSAPPLQPCGSCSDCVQAAAGSHPDLILISRPADRAFLPVELFIGDKQHRLREGLCAQIALRPFSGRRKVAIVDDADYLNQEGANCLLKTLEEPPAGSLLILVGTNPERQLPTIRSRCQVIHFRPLPAETCADLLLERQLATNRDEALQAARWGQGSLTAAQQWQQPELATFRHDLLHTLAQTDWEPPALAKEIQDFLDQAGKEAAPRRQRLRLAIDVAEQFYRAALRTLAGHPLVGDRELDAACRQLTSHWLGNAECAAACIERTQAARQHVDANANLATCVDAWLDDLSRIAVSGQPAAWPD